MFSSSDKIKIFYSIQTADSTDTTCYCNISKQWKMFIVYRTPIYYNVNICWFF